MNPGLLRTRIAIERRTATAPGDAFNGAGVKWTRITEKAYAQVTSLWAQGHQFMQAQQQRGEVTHQIVIRFNAKVAVGDRIVELAGGNRIYEIFSAEDVDRRRAYLTILAKEAK